MNKQQKTVIICVCCALIALASFMLYRTRAGYREGEKAYESLLETMQTVPPSTANPYVDPDEEYQEPIVETTWETEPEESPFPKVDFEALAETNAQVVGWIYGEDSRINYPIAQGKDNEYYLTHLFNGEENTSGCIFLDSANKSDFSHNHNIIYGHNMGNGSMFADLMQYRNPGYYENHPHLMLMTPEGNYYVNICAGYVESGWGKSWRLDFESDEDFDAWLEESIRKNTIPGELPVPQKGDKILTMSTCSYEFEDARYVVVGILEKEA